MVVSIDRCSLCRGAIIVLKWFTEQPMVVSIDRWSLYRGAIIVLKWFTDGGLYKQVVLVYRRSSRQVLLYAPMYVCV